jgi:hypothetical protein
LLNEGFTENFSTEFDLQSEFETLSLNNINYWNMNPLRSALSHLDNITIRLGKNISIRLIYDHIEEKVKELKSSRSERENLINPITVSEVIISYYGKYANIFWNDFYNCNNAEQLWEGVWLCQKANSELNNLPIKANLHELDEITMFESYGGTFDMYCYGTWDLLNRFPNILTKLDNRLQRFAGIERNEVWHKIPLPKTPPEDWTLPLVKYNHTNIVQLIKYLEEHKVS